MGPGAQDEEPGGDSAPIPTAGEVLSRALAVEHPTLGDKHVAVLLRFSQGIRNAEPLHESAARVREARVAAAFLGLPDTVEILTRLERELLRHSTMVQRLNGQYLQGVEPPRLEQAVSSALSASPHAFVRSTDDRSNHDDGGR
jgi:hypothetical protein